MKLRNFAALCMAAVLAFTAIPTTTVNASYTFTDVPYGSGVDVTSAGASQVGATTGSGYSTGHVDKNIGTLTFPTEAGNIFNYVADPERHLQALTGAAGNVPGLYAVASPSSLGVYFANSGASGVTYSQTSDAIKVTNKCSFDVNINVEAYVDVQAGDIGVTTESGVSARTDKAVYVTLNTGKSGASIYADGVAVTKTALSAARTTQSILVSGKTENFIIVQSGSAQNLFEAEYEYRVKDPLTEGDLVEWEVAEFFLEAECGQFEVTDATNAPSVRMTWSWEATGDDNSYVSSNTVSVSNKSVTLSMPNGVSVTSVVLTLNGSPTTLTSGNHYTVANNTLTFGKLASSWAGGTLRVTFSDNHTEDISIQ